MKRCNSTQQIQGKVLPIEAATTLLLVASDSVSTSQSNDDAYWKIPEILQFRISSSNLITSMNVLANDRRIKSGLCFLCSFYLSNLAQALASNMWVSKTLVRDAAWAFIQVHKATILTKV